MVNIFDLKTEEEQKVKDETLFDKSKDNKIERVTYKNYRLLEDKTLVLKGDSHIVSGINGIGKTTHLEGIIFALTGKFLDNSSPTDLVPRDKDEDTIVSVEVEFTSGMVIKREYKQNVEVNGETGEKFINGTTTTIYINDKKQKSLKEGQSTIYSELGLTELNEKSPKEIDVVMLVLVSKYLVTIPNKVLRDFFEKIVGTVDNKDIFKGLQTSEQAALFFKKYDFDLEKTKSAARKERDLTSANITSLENILKDVLIGDFEVESLEIKLQNQKEKKTKLENEISDEKAKQLGGEKEVKSSINLKIANVKTQIAEEKSKLQTSAKNKENPNQIKVELLQKRSKELENKYNIIQNELEETKTNTTNLEKRLTSFEKDENIYNNRLAELRIEYKQAVEPKKITCPCCDKEFNLNEVGEFKEILLKNTTQIKERGISTKESLAEISKNKLEITTQLENNVTKVESLKKERQLTLNEQEENISNYNKLQKETPKETTLTSERLTTLENQLKSLEVELDSVVIEFDDSNLVELIEQLKIVDESVVEIRTKLNGVEQAIEQRQFLERYKKEKTTYEQVIVLVDKANKNKLILLEEKVKAVFGEDFQIKLFDYTEDGTVKSTFDIRVKDKHDKFTSLFNGINDGYFSYRIIQLTNIIRKHFEVRNSFVLVDGLEKLDNNSFEKLKSVGQQIIGTRVVEE